MPYQGRSSIKRLMKPHVLALMLGLLFSVCYLNLFAFRAHMEVDIQTFNAESTRLKVYWSDSSPTYTEPNSQWSKLNEKFNLHQFFLPDLSDVDHLRVDPIEYIGKVKIKRITVSQPGYQTLELTTEEDFKKLIPMQHVDSAVYDGDGLLLDINGMDSQLRLQVNDLAEAGFPARYLTNVALIFIFTFGVVFFFGLGKVNEPLGVQARAGGENITKSKREIFTSLTFVPICLLVVFVFILIMAATTSFNVHPDEKAHFRALNYYSNHLLPPALDLPELQKTFSDYGRSRLGDFEVYYPLSGYFVWLVKPFHLTELTSARLFSVLLLLGLLFLTLRNHAYRFFVLPLLVTPQAWYLFSYANSDGFSLFITIITSYQVAVKDSALNRFLSEDRPRRYGFVCVALGALFATLLLLKENYYFFILFLGGYLLWRLSIGDFPEKKRLWLRLGLLVLIGLAIYGARLGWDFVVNGPDPKQTRVELAQKYALDAYKPNTPLEEKHFYLYLKERGVPFWRLLNEDKWGAKTFGSSFGVYGYTQYLGSQTYYDLMAILGWGVLLTLLFSILINAPPSIHGLFVITSGVAVTLIFMTFLASWIQVFQAQGRYLMPILPMFGILYYHARNYLFSRVFHTLLMMMFLVSAYSFLFVGLSSIEKTTAFLSQ